MFSDVFVFGTRIFDDPIIIFCKRWSLFNVEGPVSGLEVMHPIVERLRTEAVIWLIPCPWTAEDKWAANVYQRTVDAIKRIAPPHRIIVLANTKAELYNLTVLGFDAIFANQNQFADRRKFFPLLDTDRCYDAVYNARFRKYKRHHLASQINALLLIGYTFEGAEFESVIDSLPRAAYVNRQANAWNELSMHEVNASLNKAHVGLCLSRVEGAMTASIEYLLAGLPVVTTPNRGGRDVFFDTKYCRWVDSNATDVARAVAHLRAEEIPPAEIRHSTIAKIKEANSEFIYFLAHKLGIDETELRKRFERSMNHRLAEPKCLEQFVTVSK